MKVTWQSQDFHLFAEESCGYVCTAAQRTKIYVCGTLIIYTAITGPAQADLSQTRLPTAGHPEFPAGSVHGLTLLPAAARAHFRQSHFL